MVSDLIEKRKNDTIRFTYFGNDTFDAAKNMAIDEVLRDTAEKEHANFIRFFDFPSPVILLSLSDSPNCINDKAFLENIDMSRRRSGGKPIYIDSNIMAYTLTGTELTNSSGLIYQDFVHRYFGGRIAKAIEEVAEVSPARLGIGEHFAIKVDGMPIAGHAQYPIPDRIFFYHGVLAIGAWDSDRINELLRIPKKDLDTLRVLPNLLGISSVPMSVLEAKKELIGHMLTNITEGRYSVISKDDRDIILEKADDLAKETYGTKEWLLRSDNTALREDSRFCLLYPD